MARTILSNARIVLENEVIAGTLVMNEGRIEAINPGTTTTAAEAEDCDGDLLIPGLIELHTDNLERHMQPRPKVTWPHMAAILAHDAELAACGITTVFDAMRVGSVVTDRKSKYGKYARALAGELLAARGRDMLKISHFLHLRAETCSETLLEELAEFGAEDRVGILSLMDHTPGQRQFRDIEKYRDYMCGKSRAASCRKSALCRSSARRARARFRARAMRSMSCGLWGAGWPGRGSELWLDMEAR